MEQKRCFSFRRTALRCTEYTLGPVSGLISGVSLNRHLPMHSAQWHSDDSFTYLPLRGQRRIWINHTDFPFNHRVKNLLEP